VSIYLTVHELHNQQWCDLSIAGAAQWAHKEMAERVVGCNGSWGHREYSHWWHLITKRDDRWCCSSCWATWTPHTYAYYAWDDVLCSCLLIVYVWFVRVLFVPSVLWFCWFGLLTCKNRLPYNLYSVGGDVKHRSVQFNWDDGIRSRISQARGELAEDKSPSFGSREDEPSTITVLWQEVCSSWGICLSWLPYPLNNSKSNNHYLNEAVDVVQNRPHWRLMSMFVWRYALPTCACQEWISEWMCAICD